MPNSPIRYRRQPYRSEVVRTVVRAGYELELALLRVDGHWGELDDPDVPDYDSWLPSPGARNLTITEYVGSEVRRVHRYGEWIEVPADVARSDANVLDWCRRHSNSELPSGAFRVAPGDWAVYASAELDLPFLPEFDDPDETIRELAGIEAWHRYLAATLDFVVTERRDAVAAAAAAGHSRRSLGRLLDLSYARVHQLIAEAEAMDYL